MIIIPVSESHVPTNENEMLFANSKRKRWCERGNGNTNQNKV